MSADAAVRSKIQCVFVVMTVDNKDFWVAISLLTISLKQFSLMRPSARGPCLNVGRLLSEGRPPKVSKSKRNKVNDYRTIEFAKPICGTTKHFEVGRLPQTLGNAIYRIQQTRDSNWKDVLLIATPPFTFATSFNIW